MNKTANLMLVFALLINLLSPIIQKAHASSPETPLSFYQEATPPLPTTPPDAEDTSTPPAVTVTETLDPSVTPSLAETATQEATLEPSFTPTQASTETMAPTITPTASETPVPTDTPFPTDTPVPASTPSLEPSQTPTLPLETPTPLVTPDNEQGRKGTGPKDCEEGDECVLDPDGGEFRGMSGKLKVKFPKGAVSETVQLKVGPVKDWSRLPHSLSGHPFELTAEKSRDRQEVRRFESQVAIEIAYDETEINGDESTLTLFYLDEDQQIWIPLKSQVDTEQNILTGWSDHFTVFDIDTQNWQAHMPGNIQGWQVSQYTGAASYDYPIEMPPGPAGLQPSVSISHNSQIVDGASNSTQGSVVGMGWSLNSGGYIERNMRRDSQNFVGDDTFNLVIGGTSYMLLPIPDQDDNADTIDYHTTDETFMRIRRYMVYDRPSDYLTEASTWKVWNKTGMVYEFNDRKGYFSCESEATYRPWRWTLSKITNSSGKSITYQYEDHNLGKNVCNAALLTVGTHITWIVYPNNRYRVQFVYGNRTDYFAAWGNNQDAYVFYEDKKLDSIKIWHDPDGIWTNGNEEITREYRLSYETDDAKKIFPNISWIGEFGVTYKGMLTLTKIEMFGKGATSSLPPTKFTYYEMHLKTAENSYGGKVLFNYERWNASEPAKSNTVTKNIPARITRTGRHLPELVNGAYYPGSAHQISITVNNPTAGNSIWMGIQYNGSQIAWVGPVTINGTGSQTVKSPAIYLPASADRAIPVIQMNAQTDTVYVDLVNASFGLLLTKYRITSKTVSSDVASANYVYSYTYGTGEAIYCNAAKGFVEVCEAEATRYIEPYSEFRGYDVVHETISDSNRKVSTYFFQDDLQRDRTQKQEIRSGSTLLQVSTNTYETQYTAVDTSAAFPFNSSGNKYGDLNIYFTYLKSQENITYQSNGSTIAAKTKTNYAYDTDLQGGTQYGNLTNSTTYREVNGQYQSQVHVKQRYYPKVDNTYYLVGFMGYQNQYDYRSGVAESSTLLTSIQYLYDNQTNFELSPLSGLLTNKRTLLRFDGANNTDERYRDEVYGYDGWGNQAAVTVYTNAGYSSTRASSVAQTTTRCFGAYDGTPTSPVCNDDGYGTYLAWEKNPAGHPVMRWEYDKGLGVPNRETDANQAVTTAGYDSFGRITWIRRPGDENPSTATLVVAYEDGAYQTHGAPFRIYLAQKIQEGLTHAERRFYDGLGRLIQTQTANATIAENGAAPAAKDVIVDYQYNADGQILKQTMPYALNPWTSAVSPTPYRGQDFGQPYTSYSYDSSGRVTQVLQPDSTSQAWEYNGLETRSRDAENHWTTTRYDEWGQVVSVAPDAGLATSYEYDLLGRLVRVIQPGNVSTTMSYDAAGRKVSMSDPDMGAWTYTYDALGNLKTQTDARACTTTLVYDLLNRLTGKTYSGTNTGCSGTAITYGYDSGSIGHRTSMTDGSGSTAWTYDIRGRVASENKTVNGAGTYLTQWSYYSNDALQSMTYPGNRFGGAGEVVSYGYEPQGTLKTATSNEGGNFAYLSDAQYDAAGRVRTLYADQGSSRLTLAEYGYYEWTTPDKGGHLSSIRAGSSGSLLNLSYTGYDGNGNITSLTDRLAGQTLGYTYTYDALNRLTGVSGTINESYEYDGEGRLSLKNGITLHYDTTPPYEHAHAVNSTSDSNSTLYTFDYDANGNMIERNAWSYQYNGEGQMVQATENGSAKGAFVYDGDGNRVKGTVNGSTTVYIGSHYEEEISPVANVLNPSFEDSGDWTQWRDNNFSNTSL